MSSVDWDDELWRLSNPGASVFRGLLVTVVLLVAFWVAVLATAWVVML